MSVSCVRKLTFDAGHRVLGHEGKCAQPHGHTYTVYLYAKQDNGDVDELGRVIDFSVLKEKIGGWIDEFFDHQFILMRRDMELREALDAIDAPYYHLPYNPTAENIALFLLKEVAPERLTNTGVTVYKVVVWETPNCFAEVTL